MPKIVITSDLHLGLTSAEAVRALALQIAAEQPALTVLAGDLGEPLERFVACLDVFAGLPGQVAVLAGNHDVWASGGRSSQDLWERHLPEAVRAAGMLWLEEQTWQQDGLAVAGSLAWYDYSAADAQAATYPAAFFTKMKGKFTNDAKYMNWAWSDPEFAQHLGDALCERLQALEADPQVRSIVVVTHVPLCEPQMYHKPEDPTWGLSNAYFGNLTLGRRVLAMRKVQAVVSGHTHLDRDELITRPGFPDAPPVRVAVVASVYGSPAYRVVDGL